MPVITRNQSKKNLMHPIDLEGVDDDNEKNMKISTDVIDSINYKELINIILFTNNEY